MQYALILVMASMVVVAQGEIMLNPDFNKFCLMCCGPPEHGCCNDCGLSPILIRHIKRTTSTNKKVLSTKSFVDDLNSGLASVGSLLGSPDSCLDCIGPHPCCNDFSHIDLLQPDHYPNLIGPLDVDSILNHMHMQSATTEEPKSPEKDESYGDAHTGLVHGLPDILPDIAPAYYEQP